jgi:hypothetical protein
MLNGKRLPQYFLFDGTHVSMCCRFFAGKRPDDARRRTLRPPARSGVHVPEISVQVRVCVDTVFFRPSLQPVWSVTTLRSRKSLHQLQVSVTVFSRGQVFSAPYVCKYITCNALKRKGLLAEWTRFWLHSCSSWFGSTLCMFLWYLLQTYFKSVSAVNVALHE